MPTTAKQITIGPGERACINCTQYQQYYRESPVPGEAYRRLISVSFGFCRKHECNRGALRQPCRDYETKNAPPGASDT